MNICSIFPEIGADFHCPNINSCVLIIRFNKKGDISQLREFWNSQGYIGCELPSTAI